jgi:hypothetical protein
MLQIALLRALALGLLLSWLPAAWLTRSRWPAVLNSQ